MMHLEFMIGLAFSLMEKWGLGRQGVVSIYNSCPRTHTLDDVKGGLHICRYCKSKTKLTNLICRDCGSVWFHLEECHRKFHFPQSEKRSYAHVHKTIPFSIPLMMWSKFITFIFMHNTCELFLASRYIALGLLLQLLEICVVEFPSRQFSLDYWQGYVLSFLLCHVSFYAYAGIGLSTERALLL